MTFPALTWHFIYSRMADEPPCSSHKDSQLSYVWVMAILFFLTSMKQSSHIHPNSCSSNFCHPSLLNMPFSSCLFSTIHFFTLLNMRYLCLRPYFSLCCEMSACTCTCPWCQLSAHCISNCFLALVCAAWLARCDLLRTGTVTLFPLG